MNAGASISQKKVMDPLDQELQCGYGEANFVLQESKKCS